MKRLAVMLGVTLLLWVGLLAQGPLTNLMNLQVRTDSNGYLITTNGVYSGIDSPLTAFANLRGRTDSNGYLITTLSGVQIGTGGALATLDGTLFSSVAAVNNGTTVETDLITYPLPANTLIVNARGVRISAWGVSAANGNTKTVRMYFGSTLISTQVFTSSGSSWYVVGTVLRTGAATQTAGSYIITALFVGTTATTAPTETLSGAVTIKVTGQSATAGSDVTSAGMLVEAI